MGTIFAGSVVAVVIGFALRSLYKDKKTGKSCGGHCGSCKGCH